MKKIIFLLTFIISVGSLKGSHLAGAEISYKYIGDSTGVPFQYLVSLQIYRDISGIPLDLNQDICITSSCFGSQTVALDWLPVVAANGGNSRQALPVPNLTECVSPNDSDLVVTEIYFFRKAVVLGGKCADFKFQWHGNARNTNNIDNLVFGAAADLFIEAFLNNITGPNSSPVFINPAAKAFCVGSPFIWSQAAVEPDGDSLNYDFFNPLVSVYQAAACGAQVSPATWAAGYQTSQPMQTVSGITIDKRFGVFRFTPSQIENDVIAVIVKEYRFDSTLFVWRYIGSTVRDLQIPVVGSCISSVSRGPRVDVSSPGSSIEYVDRDSLIGFGFQKISNDSTANGSGGYSYKLPVIPYSCFEHEITLAFDIDVLCESISDDGSEFRIAGPDTIARPVVGVVENCKPDLTTRVIKLLLHKPLDVNGDYYLYIKKGNDGNTLTNRCGFELQPYYTIIIRVKDCPQPDYQLTNVSVNLDREIDISWQIDTASFASQLFDAWNVLRANNNGQYYVLNSLDQPGAVNLRTFKDLTLDSSDVDITQWQYQVQLVQNGRAYPPSNRIHSILLSDETNDRGNGHQYNWTVYDGWSDAAYEFQFGRYDTLSQQVRWQTLAPSRQNYYQHEYIFPQCEGNRDTTGLYAFRVLATDVNNPSNNNISESNWLFYSIDCEEPPGKPSIATIIPTVFTPNDDNQNDVFTIKSDYEQAEVAIYNRWGKLIFHYSGEVDGIAWDGTDQQSTQKVSDGVYYYIVTLHGKIEDGKAGIRDISEEKTGSLTIFTNGTK